MPDTTPPSGLATRAPEELQLRPLPLRLAERAREVWEALPAVIAVLVAVFAATVVVVTVRAAHRWVWGQELPRG